MKKISEIKGAPPPKISTAKCTFEGSEMADASDLKKGDDRAFASAKFRWLDCIALDPELSDTARRVAIRFATFYIRRHPADPKKDRVAYPSAERLSGDLSCSRASIFRAFSQLDERGFLTSERFAGATTRYRMAFPADCSRPETDGVHTAKPEESQREADADPSHRCDTPTRRTDETLPVASERPLPSHSCDPTRRTDATQIPGNENREENPGNLKPSGRSASPHADAHEGENPGSEFLIERDSPSGKIAEAESSQGAFREVETKAAAKPTEIPRSGRARTHRDSSARSAPKQLALISAPSPNGKRLANGGLPAHLVEPFEEFWSIYPRPDDKGTARIEFEQAANDGRGTPAEIIEGARRYRAERAQDTRDPATVRRYTAKPATWLRAESWTNAPAPTSAPRAAPIPFQTVRQRTHDSIRAKLAEWRGESEPGEMKDITPNTIVIEG
jgi:hypothetical protein